MGLLLVKAAKQLGSDKEMMDAYWAYHKREQNGFFSPNPHLKSATEKPFSFPDPDNWRKLNSEERKKKWYGFSLKQRMTIATLAGFGYEGKGISLNSSHHFSTLREAYANAWRDDLYSVFWSDSNHDKRWLCNVFVGDAIYLYNRKSFTSGNSHYYDPLQIYMGKSFLRRRNSYRDVQAGDIVVFRHNGRWEHVEIITRIQKNTFSDDGFCSIGAGRGLSPNNNHGTGKEKCDGFFSDPTREINNNSHTYFFL